MAADGTYYWPSAEGMATRPGGKAWNHFFHLTLTGGSGTATATVEGTLNDFSSSTDITDLFGASSFTVWAGATRTFVLQDDAPVPKLSGYHRVRIKIVLDTAGINDADYSVTMVRH